MSSTGTLEAGTLVAGRYRIEEPLGGDGSSAVYRATDLRLERAVGLRALPPSDAAQQGKAAARLVHPNVARVLDFGADAELGVEFVVADLGTGGSLAALLAQRGTPPLPLATRIVQEAAAGMAAGHRAGLVHGDLHPGVLWLSRDEGRLRVQVLGLGLNPAGALPSRATARYASPERLRKAKDLAPAADVFSLGVVAFEVFAGLPAEWTSLLVSMARGQAVMAPSLLDAKPEMPAHVAQAVRRALLADPAQRWPDAGELAAHLIAESVAAPAPAPAVVATPVVPVAPEPVAITAPLAAEAPVPATPETVKVVAVPTFADAAPAASAEPVDAPAAVVATVPEVERTVDVEPMAAAASAVIADVVPPAPIAEAPATPVPAPAPVETSKRQPPVRRPQPLAATRTDLADSLYIPPPLAKAAPAPRLETPAPAPVAAAPAPKPEPAPEPVLAKQPEPVIAAAEPVAPVPAADETIVAPVVALVPATQSVAVMSAEVQEVAVIPLDRRRTSGLARLGKPAGGQRRGLLAASIAAVVLVGGAVVARTVLAGSSATPAVQGIASNALAAVGSARPQPQQPAAQAPVPELPPVDSAARAAMTPEEQKRLDEERRKLEEQRRLQIRQRDSIRAAQQLAAQQAAAPQQVALAAVPQPAASAPAPQVAQSAPTAPATTPVEAAAAPATPARPRVDPSRVYGGGEVDQPPSLANATAFRTAVNRSYPTSMEGTGEWGNAMVSFTVGLDGRVERESVHVDQASHQAFRSAAVAALRAARFNPARVDGQPVRASVSMPITWQGSRDRDED
jgi:TonB family protein